MTTTSLKLPETLKSQIAATAARQGKTAHALMVETLQTAMDDAALRQQFYADGEAAYQETLRTNQVYRADDVFAWMRARVKGENPAWPKSVPFLDTATNAQTKPSTVPRGKPHKQVAA